MKRRAIIFFILICVLPAAAFQMHSRLDPRVDPEDSPTFFDLTLNGGNIMSPGPINLKPSGDNITYLSFLKEAGIATMKVQGGSAIGFSSAIGGILFRFNGTDMFLGWDDDNTTGVFQTVGEIDISTTTNNNPIVLTPHGTGQVIVNSVLSMTYENIIEPGSIDASVDPLAILEKIPDAYWRFEAGLTDSSGNGYTLTKTAGTEAYGDRGTSKFVVFDDATHYSPSGYKGVTGTAAKSVCMWVRTGTIGNNAAVFSTGDQNAGGKFWSVRGQPNGTLNYFSGNEGIATTVTIDDEEWHHFAITAPSGGAGDDILMYVDGADVTGAPIVGGVVNDLNGANDDISIGCHNNGQFWEGDMDEVAFFTDVLTPTEITNIYNRQNERVIRGTSNSQIDWTLDGNAQSPFGTEGSGTFGGDVTAGGDGIFGTMTVGSGSITDSSGDISIDATVTIEESLIVGGDADFDGDVTINTTEGIDYGPGFDQDVDIFTVLVTGLPRFYWDESAEEFVFTVPISAPAYRGSSDIHMDEDGVFFGINDEAKIHVGLTAAPDPADAWILENVSGSHDLLLKTARSLKIEAAEEMEISITEAYTICFGDNVHVEMTPGLIEFFPNGPTGTDETILTMSNDVQIPIFAFDAQESNINIIGYPGDIDPNESYLSTHINIDDTLAVNSDATTEICGLDFGTTNMQAATKVAMCVNAGFDFALIVRGAPKEDPDYGYENTAGTSTDRVNSASGGDDSFISDVNNVPIFDNQNDYILIGSDSTFEDIQVALDVFSSGSIFSNPSTTDIYYSRAGGNWAPLTILDDGTNGFQNAGNITFNAPGDWTKDDEDMDEVPNAITNAYYIAILRTRAVLGTVPTELIFHTFASLKTGMAIRGDATYKPVSLPDSLAPNESIYYSTTKGNLVYKDSGGTVNDLY